MQSFFSATGRTLSVVSSQPLTHAMRMQAHWIALRKGSALPARHDFNPADLQESLPYLMLLERVEQGQIRLRIAGEAIVALFGFSPQGVPLGTLFESASRGLLAHHFEEMHRKPARLTLTLQRDAGYLRKPQRASLLVLPMTGPDGSCSRYLACLSGEFGETPGQFALKAVEYQEITEGYGTSSARSYLRLVKG